MPEIKDHKTELFTAYKYFVGMTILTCILVGVELSLGNLEEHETHHG